MADLPRDVLVCVAPDKIDGIWPHVSHFIESAIEHGRGDDTSEVVKADLDAGRSLLWVVWDGSGLLAAATTKIVNYPTKKACVVTSCGGRELPRWIAFINDLMNYAKSEGCAVMRISGREGWKAMLPDFRQPFIVLEKVL